jgi:hypothetical protein
MLLALPGGQRLAAGHGEGVASLLALADPGAAPLLAITADPAQPLGSRPLGAAALAQPLPTPLGDFRLALAFGQALLPVERSAGAALARGLTSTAVLRLSRQFGGLTLAGEARFDDERGSLAGSRLAAGFGLNGATTSSLGFSARLVLGRIELAGDWRRAHSRLRLGSGLIRGSDGLSGTAASVSAQLPGLWRVGDSLVFTVTRPLALAGPLQLAGFSVPVWAGPQARETALEAGYALPLVAGGRLQFSLFHRDNPGHIAASPDDDGAAVQLGWRW